MNKVTLQSRRGFCHCKKFLLLQSRRTYELYTSKQNCFRNLEVLVVITMNLPRSTCKTSHAVPTWKEEAVSWSIKTNRTKTLGVITGFTIT